MISTQDAGSDGDEGTTALPRMQYKSAAAAVGAEIGVLDAGSQSGSTVVEGGKKEKEKSMLDRIGFKKKK
jgi:hypothetical protein